MKRFLVLGLTTIAALTLSARSAAGTTITFKQINMVTSNQLLAPAPNTDPNLINPWGLSYSATSPFWAADQGSGKSTLYNALGVPQALVVTVPPTAPPFPSGPTGTAFVGVVGGSPAFAMGDGGTATFVFATLAGTIDSWRNSLSPNTSALVEYSSANGAIYTGLTVLGDRLYAADAFNNVIDVFDQNFDKTTPSGSFIDPIVPPGFPVYNIQAVGGKLYVEYAPPPGALYTGGFVGVFDANGNFLQHIGDSHLISPWGITQAPATFGAYGGDLLVGNFGDGTINAFDAVTGAYQGTIMDAFGNPIVNDGLWGLAFRTGGGFNTNALYFAAGINNEQDGLIGRLELDPIPEPATLSLLGIGLAGLGLRRRKKN